MLSLAKRLRTAFAPARPGSSDTATSLQILVRLLAENGRRHARRYFAATVFMLIASGCTALSAWMMEDVINGVFVERDRRQLFLVASAIAAIFLVKGVSTYAHSTLLARIGNRIVAELRQRVYDSLLTQSLPFFQASKPGDLVNRMVATANGASQAINMVFTGVGRDLTTLAGLVAVMVLKNLTMTVIALVIAPVAILAVARISRRIAKIARETHFSNVEVVAAVQETAHGADMIKAFTLEERMRERTGAAIRMVRQRSDRAARLQAQSSPIMETLGGFSFAAVILYGGLSVIEGATNPGAFFAFLTALLLAYEPAKKLSRTRLQIEAELVSARLLYEIVDHEPSIRDAPDARALTVTEGGVEFRDVRFAYPGSETPALDGLSFTAAPGAVTALVGHSGAGKSTAFALIERFYVPTSGEVRIDGQDIESVAVRTLRQQVSLVSQNTFLFDGSVLDNLLVGRPDATEADILAAARAAHADEFIRKLPEEYNTLIGENGMSLSGGQRQRLAIARALLRDAPLLLLDEPTASLDAESENRIQLALAALLKGRTAIVIAHRLATVRRADRILVMDAGRVVQRGTHDELLAEGGIYRRLHDLQFRDPAPEAGRADRA